MDPDREKLIYAIEHELCPECCTELEYECPHERDSTHDRRICSKCGWGVSMSTWDEVIDEENLEQGSKAEY